MAVATAADFFKDMGQPFEMPKQMLYDAQRLSEINTKPT